MIHEMRYGMFRQTSFSTLNIHNDFDVANLICGEGSWHLTRISDTLSNVSQFGSHLPAMCQIMKKRLQLIGELTAKDRMA